MNKLECKYEYDKAGGRVLLISKKRGKLTFKEVQDFLLYSSGGAFNGNYYAVIRASESLMGCNGWTNDDNKGDSIELYEID